MFNIRFAFLLPYFPSDFEESQQNSVSNIFTAYYNFKVVGLSIANGQTSHSIVWNVILPILIIVLMKLLLFLKRYGSF
jgi:hypothetical protein